jgi:hypothetical protein
MDESNLRYGWMVDSANAESGTTALMDESLGADGEKD